MLFDAPDPVGNHGAGSCAHVQYGACVQKSGFFGVGFPIPGIDRMILSQNFGGWVRFPVCGG